MADITYHEQEEQHNLDLIRNVCNDLPDYVKRFVRGVQQTTSPRTRLGYVRDIKIFFEYICESIPNILVIRQRMSLLTSCRP